MQTFLPLPDYEESARVLDYRRLGKQRVECKQILNALTGESKGWVNHPATKMWRGHEYHLILYALYICEEWCSRGYSDTLNAWFRDKLKVARSFCDLEKGALAPPWLGQKDFHASHRSNLLRKDPDWYGQFNWPESDDMPYVWPTPTGSVVAVVS